MERGKSQAAIQSPDSASPAGVMFSALSIYTQTCAKCVGEPLSPSPWGGMFRNLPAMLSLYLGICQ